MTEENKQDQWEEVVGEKGQTIRWTEEPKDAKQAEKTIYIGNEIVGVYVKKLEGVGENGATIYQIKHATHGLLSVWDTTVLADKMEEIPVGSEVKIEMIGTQKPKNGGKAYFNFKVFHRAGPMVEAKPDVEEPEL